MIKAVFFDIDGTLVPFESKRCLPSTKQALEQLRQRGILTFVATGRARLEMERAGFLTGMHFDGYITANGQYCYSEEKVYYEDPIPRTDVENLYHYLQSNDCACFFMEEDASYLNRVNQRVEDIFAQLHTPVPPVAPLERILQHKLYQIAAYVPHQQEEIFLQLMPGCKATSWHPLELDLFPRSGGKMPAIQATLKHFSLRPEEIMAFGDGKNDRDMVAFAGIGVAMGDGAESVKAAADYVTTPAAQDGIALALRRFGLID